MKIQSPRATPDHSIDFADRRVFLGLDRPPLSSATEWLFENYATPTACPRLWDLENLIIVLPTTRGKIRLGQLLASKANETSVSYLPPILTTIGELPEFLYSAQKTLASDLVQHIAWSRAVAEMDAEDYTRLTGRQDDERPADWRPIASLISALHARLSTDIWSFRSVAREVAQQKGFLKEELARWEVLEKIQQSYYRILGEVNLWDKQAARNFAAAGLLKAGEIRCRTSKTIVMLAVADLPRSISEMLRQVAVIHPDQVRILIAASPGMSERFDEFGNLDTAQWLAAPIKLCDEKIRIVDQPADQALAIAHFLCQLDDVSTDEVTIGVPDEAVIPQLERVFNQIEMPHRVLAGRELSETGPVKLLKACRDYLTSYRFDALASLVRHPDMFHWLSEQVATFDWLTELDVFQNQKLPQIIELTRAQPFGDPAKIVDAVDANDPSAKARAERLAQAVRALNDVHGTLFSLFKPLLSREKSIDYWAIPWQQVLATIYGGRALQKSRLADRQTLLACETINAALAEQLHVPPALQSKISAMDALDWALNAAAERRVPPPENPQAIELAGWLDLALDDAPVIGVTGMNDDSVPTTDRGHPFLPNELCRQLGIVDDERRFARDCYALTIITSVRENYLLVVGRRSDSGEPLKPSRLLFADSGPVAAKRAKAFFGFSGNSTPHFWLAPDAQFQSQQAFKIPQPQLETPITQLSVTRFRDYIKCPYRFYLKHVLRLENLADDLREMDAGVFGDLIHQCLEAFGNHPVGDSRDAGEISRFLDQQLDLHVQQQYPGQKYPAVEMQIEQIRSRFKRFAEIQAHRRAEGWRIVSTEQLVEYDFNVDGTPFRIRGQIDRIDQHETTGQVAVWDYKSSDKGEGPVEVHYSAKKKEWKDLQLPLYRLLVEEIEAVRGADFSNLITGYLILSKRLEDIRFVETDWQQVHYQDAAEVARSIVRKIRQSVFWPPNPVPPLYSQEFSAICQDSVFEQFSIGAMP